MKEDKKVYPSQLATKAIAARIPAEDYVRFLNDAIDKGISINDWLLTKIYKTDTEKSVSGTTNSKNENQQKIDYILSNFKFEEQENDDGICWPMIADDSVYLYDWKYVDRWVLKAFENSRKVNKEPSLIDAKTQIALIAKEKFSNKDFKEFFEELNDLLEELE
jgi:hypothetical protein